MIITKGYGWEAMGTDSTGVNFNIANDLTLQMEIENELNNRISINAGYDLTCITIDDIDIKIDLGE
jgi:hypothetical protein